MFLIDYDSTFELTFKKSDDPSEFYDNVNYLKMLWLKWNGRAWAISVSKIRETLLWFKKDGYDFTLSDSAKLKIEEIKNGYAPETSYFRDRRFDKSVLNEGVCLYPYQEVGVNWLLKRSRAYLADDPGIGKTCQTVAYLSCLYKQNQIDGVLLVVRLGLQYQWLKEILEFSNLFTENDIVILDNTTKERPFENCIDKKIIIVSNHLVAKMFASYRKDYNKGKGLSKIKWTTPFVDIKKEWNKKNLLLVCDEAHELKNSSSLRSKAVYAHRNAFYYRLLLSATPSVNRFEDWWMGTKLLDTSIIPYEENEFKLEISNKIGDKFNRYSIKSYNVLKIENIRCRLSTFVLKRLKFDLPEMKTKQIVRPIYLQMPFEQKDIYQTFVQQEVLKLENEFDKINIQAIFQKFPYLIQVLDNVCLLEGKVINEELQKKIKRWKFEKDPRVSYCVGALEDYIEYQNDKVVIFDNHPLTLNLLCDKFKSYSPLVIHGQLQDTTKERQDKIDLFNDKGSIHKLLLMSTQVGGAGFNLNKACSRIIFYTSPFDSVLFKQAQERVSRINSVRDSMVDILLLDHSIDLIRYKRNINRLQLNDEFLTKDLTRDVLKNLLEGIV